MNDRVTIPRTLFEKFSKVWALYDMGLLVPAPGGASIKLPARDGALPPARVDEPEPVGTGSSVAPDKLPDAPILTATGLSTAFRPTPGTYAEEEFLAANPEARKKKDASDDRHSNPS